MNKTINYTITVQRKLYIHNIFNPSAMKDHYTCPIIRILNRLNLKYNIIATLLDLTRRE